MNSGFVPLLWFALHWQAICGWAFLIVALYKFIRFMVKAITVLTSLADRATDAEQTIHLLSTNHLPHIQVELEKSNEHLSGLREEISKVLKVIYPYEHE